MHSNIISNINRHCSWQSFPLQPTSIVVVSIHYGLSLPNIGQFFVHREQRRGQYYALQTMYSQTTLTHTGSHANGPRVTGVGSILRCLCVWWCCVWMCAMHNIAIPSSKWKRMNIQYTHSTLTHTKQATRRRASMVANGEAMFFPCNIYGVFMMVSLYIVRSLRI